MGMFLNSKVPMEEYKRVRKRKYFVDKSKMLEQFLPIDEMDEPYLCITRPRRFGKSVAAHMIASFFEKGTDANSIFTELDISKNKHYKEHLNQHNVIFIDFSRVPEENVCYKSYIGRISNGIKEDVLEQYSNVPLKKEHPLWDILSQVFMKTGDKFIFVMDEWDAAFHMSFVSKEEQKEYLSFLKNLLKNQPYVELAYMTGVLPISKYSSGSELNMFIEYDMTMTERFSEYFGFSDNEVDELYEKYKRITKQPKITREQLRIWYDGYYTASEEKLYNPRSIVCSLTDNQIRSYWTSSGPYDEIFYYIKNDINDIRDDLVFMISGEGVWSKVKEYAAVSMELATKDEIYSAMVVYGLLTYKDGKVYVPNRELMGQFNDLLMRKDSLGYVYRLARKSKEMLEATLRKDTKTMEEILEFAHNTESPILTYNSEIELSFVVNLIYLEARDWYRVEREDKAGKGYVDFIFYPERKGADAIILELKVDATPEKAIEQMKEKNYVLRFQGKMEQKTLFTGKVLLVGMSYNTKTKQHRCKVEEYDLE